MSAVFHKYQEISFIHVHILFTFLVLILQLASFICPTWKRKQTMEQ